MAKPLVVGLVAALLLVGCGGGCQPVEGVVTGAVQRERKKILQGLIPRDYSATRHHYSPKRGEDWSGQGCGELLVSGHYWSGVSVEKMEEMEGSLEHAWGKKQTSPPVPSTTKVSMFATDDPHGGIGSVPRRGILATSNRTTVDDEMQSTPQHMVAHCLHPNRPCCFSYVRAFYMCRCCCCSGLSLSPFLVPHSFRRKPACMSYNGIGIGSFGTTSRRDLFGPIARCDLRL
ncbi:hypothetical protein IWZ00DRAFT_52319 [Phyllosticta capitalensis]|uniref:Uncharacterized protein n=1 Tax=Phyllosticta capitalensis TaxID=121624 RepID=A0ABR1YLI2_9PEZI